MLFMRNNGESKQLDENNEVELIQQFGIYMTWSSVVNNYPPPPTSEKFQKVELVQRPGGFSLYAVYADVPLDRYGLAKNCLT